jgi:hypothetical protein
MILADFLIAPFYRRAEEKSSPVLSIHESAGVAPGAAPA